MWRMAVLVELRLNNTVIDEHGLTYLASRGWQIATGIFNQKALSCRKRSDFSLYLHLAGTDCQPYWLDFYPLFVSDADNELLNKHHFFTVFKSI